MKVKVIDVFQKKDQSIDVNVGIEGKKTLTISFQGVDDLPLINDCVFLFLYLQSMQEGTDLCFPKEATVSKTLIDNLSELQNIFKSWFKNILHPINVEAVASTDNYKAKKGDISLFSGGGDSLYTFIENKDTISHLLLCIGVDIQLNESEKINEVLEKYNKFSAAYNKNLIVVTTNIRHVFPDGERTIQHAAIFASLALACGYEKLFIPGSHNIDELDPWGSHPMTDQLFSNGITQVIHHGPIYRSEKLTLIAQTPNMLRYLRVCNSSKDFNCGQCEKCLRTLFIFKVLDINVKLFFDDHSFQSNIKKIKIQDESEKTFWDDNYQFALKHNHDTLAGVVQKLIFKYDVKQWIKSGIQLFKQK